MTTLAIETATANRNHPASLAIAHEGKEQLLTLAQPNSQAAQLVSAIESLLSARELWYSDIKRLIVTVGPGSFTGIRIGLAVARSIAFACPTMELVSMTTLEALAGKCNEGKEFMAVLRAGKGDIYAQRFSCEDGVYKATAAIALCTPDALPQPLLPLFGNGIQNHETSIDALDLLRAPERVCIEPRECTPLYIRPPDAQLPKAGTL